MLLVGSAVACGHITSTATTSDDRQTTMNRLSAGPANPLARDPVVALGYSPWTSI
jgi:hypothetical protein